MSDATAYLANAPRRRSFGIDELLVGHLDLAPGDEVAELGCGSGFTLAEAAAAAPDVRVVGLDRDREALQSARDLFAGGSARFQLIEADLNRPLPLASESANKMICHNVLEQMSDPAALVDEATRVMRSGGRSVWSHPDYDSVVISGGDVALTRRIVHLFSDYVDPVDTLRNACRTGAVDLTLDELESWRVSLEDAEARGQFLYSHITYVVVADKV